MFTNEFWKRVFEISRQQSLQFQSKFKYIWAYLKSGQWISWTKKQVLQERKWTYSEILSFWILLSLCEILILSHTLYITYRSSTKTTKPNRRLFCQDRKSFEINHKTLQDCITYAIVFMSRSIQVRCFCFVLFFCVCFLSSNDL